MFLDAQHNRPMGSDTLSHGVYTPRRARSLVLAALLCAALAPDRARAAGPDPLQKQVFAWLDANYRDHDATFAGKVRKTIRTNLADKADWYATFGPDVTAPIALHVEAKRYLCAVEPDYFDRLSEASRLSLATQGGAMTAAEAAAFAAFAERFPSPSRRAGKRSPA